MCITVHLTRFNNVQIIIIVIMLLLCIDFCLFVFFIVAVLTRGPLVRQESQERRDQEDLLEDGDSKVKGEHLDLPVSTIRTTHRSPFEIVLIMYTMYTKIFYKTKYIATLFFLHNNISVQVAAYQCHAEF